MLLCLAVPAPRHTSPFVLAARFSGRLFRNLGYADALLDNLAVEQMNGALGMAGKALVVGDHADGRTFAMELLKQFHHSLTISGIEVSGRLVRQQDRRLTCESAR